MTKGTIKKLIGWAIAMAALVIINNIPFTPFYHVLYVILGALVGAVYILWIQYVDITENVELVQAMFAEKIKEAIEMANEEEDSKKGPNDKPPMAEHVGTITDDN